MDARIAGFHYYAALASSATSPMGVTVTAPLSQYARCAAVQSWWGGLLLVVAPLVALALQQVCAC